MTQEIIREQQISRDGKRRRERNMTGLLLILLDCDIRFLQDDYFY
mgnify:CR=1 FL=1